MMHNFSFGNRIASNYIITTALLIGVVFTLIFFVVKIDVAKGLDEDLQKEVDKHFTEIQIKDGTIALKHHKEWMEREHNTIGVDPVFIEFVDRDGRSIDKSPNLKDGHLEYNIDDEENVFYNKELVEKRIKQAQISVKDEKGEVVGYLLVAVSREGYEIVLDTLLQILLITYPFILIILFVVARFIVVRSIAPINNIIDTSNKISRTNLHSRIPLPHHKDELYILSDTINHLIARIQHAIEREKNFTSYASHEFRTPLTVLKGTLEVLIRKPRTTEEYQDKIKYCLGEIDRLNNLVDQLLMLTRYESLKQSLNLREFDLNTIIDNSLISFQKKIVQKEIEIQFDKEKKILVTTDSFLLNTILDNILSNAIKYSHTKGKIMILISEQSDFVFCEIKDFGIGVPQKDLAKIFDKFYRSTDCADIKGFGLGLAIVEKFASLLEISVKLDSIENQGTSVLLKIPRILSKS